MIFLDDLQWVDSASLQLIKLLMNEQSHLLLIGTYRDNEVSPIHPFMLTVEELQKDEIVINTITLKSLQLKDINYWVADTLTCSTVLAQPLAELIGRKTQGNPFFITQFLKTLYQEGYINFNSDRGYWECDIAQITTLALTDDVVEFMAQQLQKLPSETQEVLKLAACIGNQFDLETLAIVSQKSVAQAAISLWKALQEGLIIPISQVYKFFQLDDTELSSEHPSENTANPSYRFLHDRVQQAAYSLISEDLKRITHLQIGRLLLQNTDEQDLNQNLFKIVNQLNTGVSLLQHSREREELLELNLAAAQKAKASIAYDAACSYLEVALECADINAWHTQYPLMLKLHNLLAEVNYLNGRFEAAKQQIELVLQQTSDILDQIKVYEIRIQLLIAQSQYQEALDAGLEALALLKIPLDREPLPNIDIDSLYVRSPIRDRRILATLNVLAKLWAPAYISSPELMVQVIVTMLNLSVTHGNSAISSFAYALYGMLLCANSSDIELGYRFGTLSLHVLEQYEDAEFTCKVNQLFYAFIRNWKERTHDRVHCLADNVQTGLETGELEFACYSAINYCDNLCIMGEPLEAVHQKQNYYIELTHNLQQEFQHISACIWGQFVDNLLGKVDSPKQLIGERFDEQKQLSKLEENKSFTALFFFYTAKSVLNYLFHDYKNVLSYSEIAIQYEQTGSGLLPITQVPLYRALAYLSLYPTADSQAQAEMLAEVETHHQRLISWAIHAPENFQHKVNLITAEMARVLNQREQAIEFYDRAISGAQTNGYVHEEGLANELAAKFYLNWDKEKVAASYMQDAYYCYAKWGAKAKLADLENRYSTLLTPILQQQTSSSVTEKHFPIADLTITQIPTAQAFSSNSTNTFSNLDLATVLKASQTLSSEIEMDKLLTILLHTVLESAGADRGVLLMPHSTQWFVEAVTAIDCPTQVQPVPLSSFSDIPKTLINIVKRSLEPIVIQDANIHSQLAIDGYIIRHQPKSLLCIPILQQGKLVAILYLENQVAAGVFTRDRIEIIKLLTSQAAISLENARLYQKVEVYSHSLEAEVERKTQALNQKNQALEQAFRDLQKTQAQLIQTEKMSSLGQMVAGVAHEINNPVSFIKGNLTPLKHYFENLMSLLKLYQEEYPCPSLSIQSRQEEIDLEFLFQDAIAILRSMNVGSDRIQEIVMSLRNFSRLDESLLKAVDLHSGIDSTLSLVQHRLNAANDLPAIGVVRDYDSLPTITCYPSQINQVFLNIINNAIDAIRENPNCGKKPEIRICTEVLDKKGVCITIANTDSAIPKDIQERIFDPFFTTKPVGSGTGLGLFVSYSIVQNHGGAITVRSQPGEETAFEIILPYKCS